MKASRVRIDVNIKRGAGEFAVLAILSREVLHGYGISKRIAEVTEGALHFNLASLYPVLHRMEKRGWVKGTWDAAQRVRKRRSYRLTHTGKMHLVSVRKAWESLDQALRLIAGDGRT